MSRLSKLLLAFFILLLVILSVEAYLYWQTQKQLPPSSEQKIAAKPGFSQVETELTEVEIEGLALVGYLNLLDISKSQVENWASNQGVLMVPAYSGPLPTLSPELATLSADVQPVKLPATTKVLVGYFRRTTLKKEIVLAQKETEVTVSLNEGSRLWLKEQDKLQVVSEMLENLFPKEKTSEASLLSSGTLSQYLQPGDLLLVPGVQEQTGQFKTSNLVVFK